MRVVLDTNVLVSALLKPKSVPDQVLQACLRRPTITMRLSDDTLHEYWQVTSRNKFSRALHFNEARARMLPVILQAGAYYYPQTKHDVLRDSKDNIFIDLVVEAQADFFVTGNLKDFPAGSFGKTVILSPSEFIKRL